MLYMLLLILLLLTEIVNKMWHISYNVKILYQYYGVLKWHYILPWRIPSVRGGVFYTGNVHWHILFLLIVFWRWNFTWNLFFNVCVLNLLIYQFIFNGPSIPKEIRHHGSRLQFCEVNIWFHFTDILLLFISVIFVR